MSKSQQKRICIQSQCVVRDELRQQLDTANDKINRLCDALLEAADYIHSTSNGAITKKYIDKYRVLVKEVK